MSGSPLRTGASIRSSPASRRPSLAGRLADLLKQGLSVRRLAASIATGAAVGTSPLIGTTTLTCSALALVFRLNPVVTLTVNYAVYPLQLAMIFPFAAAGGRITGWSNLPFDPRRMSDMIRTRGWQTLEPLAGTFGNAFLAWLVWAPAVFFLVYFGSTAFLRRLPRQ